MSVAASLPLIDVNKLTVDATWPLLVSAISSAHFIAIDLELSGIGWGRTRSAVDTMERYRLLCDVASSYSILSMGVACFQWQPPSSPSDVTKTHCKVEAFNVWMLSQRSYTIDPSSAQFLIEHGFDFNKQYSLGLPYTPAHFTVSDGHSLKYCEVAGHLPTLFALILSNGCPLIVHNGLMDLLFLYSHLYTSLPPRFDVFMADLSEMCTGGVYDTKAIAELHLHEQASFLEYIFRKNQRRDLLAASGHSLSHLQLMFADYADLGVDYVEFVSVLPPPPPPLELLMNIQLCHTFTSYGYCRTQDCPRSHDVLLGLAVEEYKLELIKAKRKRRKEMQALKKRRKVLSGEGAAKQFENTVNHDIGDLDPVQLQVAMPGSETETKKQHTSESEAELMSQIHKQVYEEVLPKQELQEGERLAHTTPQEERVDLKQEHKELSELFEHELSTAKKKLSQQQQQRRRNGERESRETRKLRPSFGHRAGFDAFMTGYTFASIAVDLSKAVGSERQSRSNGVADELREMRNKLPSLNRKSMIPLSVAKSHFTSTSQLHKTTQMNIKEYFKHH